MGFVGIKIWSVSRVWRDAASVSVTATRISFGSPVLDDKFFINPKAWLANLLQGNMLELWMHVLAL